MPTLGQHLPQTRQVGLGQALQADTSGLEMHGHEHSNVVQHRRQQREQRHLQVGHAEELGHHEGRRPHDGWHQLPAGGRHGLDRPGEGRPVAGAHHQRDREGAGGHHIGHCAARDGTEQAAGDDGHLGRPARGVTGQGQRKVHEQLARPAALDEGAEQDEQHHVGRRDVQRDAEDALGGEVELVQHHRHRLPAQRQAVEQKGCRSQRQRPACGTACGFHEQHDESDAEDIVGRPRVVDVVDPPLDVGKAEARVERYRRGRRDEDQVGPAEGLAPPSQARQDHVGQHEGKGQVHAPHHVGVGRPGEGDVEVEGRHGRGHDRGRDAHQRDRQRGHRRSRDGQTSRTRAPKRPHRVQTTRPVAIRARRLPCRSAAHPCAKAHRCPRPSPWVWRLPWPW